MIRLNYTETGVEFAYLDSEGNQLPFNCWLEAMKSAVFFNIVNDLLVNGLIDQLNDQSLYLPYEEVSKLDDFEYRTLNLPDPYPFDIFIDIKGTGLKDTSLKIIWAFQDFAHGDGTGNILQFVRKGAYLKGISEYLLETNQFFLLQEIDQINESNFSDTNQVLQAIGRIQQKALRANAVMAKILVETEIVAPDKMKIDVEKIGENKYRLKPLVDKIDSKRFQEKFNLFPGVKPEYHFRDDHHKVHVVIGENNNSDGLKTELKKLKVNSIFSQEDVLEMYNNPTKYWNDDIWDMELFGKRVLELGIYKPKFYPFISPYKSQWIPGIKIEDRIRGTRLINIKNESDLNELKARLSEAQIANSSTLTFKDEEIDVNSVLPFIAIAEKQLKNPSVPVSKEFNKSASSEEYKVLIIKENTELLEFEESKKIANLEELHFQPIDNMSVDIQLKEHQEHGIAWLQTLYMPPFSVPGVLLADDMGLGKTIQVLYFIEWYSQKQSEKPVLIVAPVSLLENWQNEYRKFFPTPSLTAITLWGNQVSEYIFTGNKGTTIANLSKKAIYLTTYETLRRQQIPMGMIDWGIVIMDEAQKIKTPGTFVTNAAKALKSDFKIAMTGTPVENSLMDLWCIIDFCSPGLLENAKSFSNKYQKPLKDKDVDYDELSTQLRDEIGGTLLRRMKVDVAKDLPTIDYFKFKEIMPPEQFEAYANEVNQINENSKIQNAVLQGILNLRSLSDHPYLKHYQLEEIPTKELIRSSAKLKKTIDILTEIKNKHEKAIVFTENKSMQRVLRKVFRENFLLNPAIINGETPTGSNTKTKLSRQQEIDRYQAKDGFNVIIMSPVAAGFGLNITEANHVIHYTRHWNPAKEQQATDRAYRIGQKKPVQVYYPMAIAPNQEIKTFDLVLDDLLSRKSHLAKSTLFPTDQIEISKDEFALSIGINVPESKELVIDKISSLDLLQPLVFESAIAVLMEKANGGKSFLTNKSNDKGVDIVHFNDNGNILIQVKQSSGRQGINSGQEVKYALSKYKDQYQCEFDLKVITNNYFTQSAIEMANMNGVELMDRDVISLWINHFRLTMNEIDRKMEERV